MRRIQFYGGGSWQGVTKSDIEKAKRIHKVRVYKSLCESRNYVRLVFSHLVDGLITCSVYSSNWGIEYVHDTFSFKPVIPRK